MEIDSYLKSIKQSISILDKHVAQLKEDNAVQISLVEGKIATSRGKILIICYHLHLSR